MDIQEAIRVLREHDPENDLQRALIVLALQHADEADAQRRHDAALAAEMDLHARPPRL